MNPSDAHQAALALAEYGLDADTATSADLDTAADYAGVDRPEGPAERHDIRDALSRIVSA